MTFDVKQKYKVHVFLRNKNLSDGKNKSVDNKDGILKEGEEERNRRTGCQ